MTERWVRERKADPYYRLAKRTGYRSRAAFKLQQIHARFGVLRKGFAVVDLGCAPGGWSQVAAELVGPSGVVVGVDLARVARLPSARFLRGDVTDPRTVYAVREELARARGLKAGQPFLGADAVLSDMSPNISGIYSVDQARSVVLARAALGAARALLRPGGNFAVKVFEGEDFDSMLEAVEAVFRFVKVHAPPASRKQSSEVFIVAKGFRGGRAVPRRRARSEEE